MHAATIRTAIPTISAFFNATTEKETNMFNDAECHTALLALNELRQDMFRVETTLGLGYRVVYPNGRSACFSKSHAAMRFLCKQHRNAVEYCLHFAAASDCDFEEHDQVMSLLAPYAVSKEKTFELA